MLMRKRYHLLTTFGRSSGNRIGLYFPGRASIEVLDSQQAEMEPVDELAGAILPLSQSLGFGIGGFLLAPVGLLIELFLFRALLLRGQRLAIFSNQPFIARAI